MRDFVSELRDFAGGNDCHIAHCAADHIDALARELDQANRRIVSMGEINDALVARLAEAEALLKVARADAERYRWLRGDGGPTSLRWPRWSVQHWTGFWNPVHGADMDAAIDALLTADSATHRENERG